MPTSSRTGHRAASASTPTTPTEPAAGNRPNPCPSCGASSLGCYGVRLLTGRDCCESCTGVHDNTEEKH